MAEASSWTPAFWQGEKAWESRSQGWKAVVSEERGRLIALVEEDSGENLLFAPDKGGISLGGHRCWLGPQAGWNPVWPPPADWECGPAARVESEGGRLRLLAPHTAPAYPRLSRTYEWKGESLSCTLRWEGGDFFGIQILQVPRWALVHVEMIPSASCPRGYGFPQLTGPEDVITDAPFPAFAGRLENGRASLWHANSFLKTAFAPQEIVAQIGSHELRMRRGREHGTTARRPDRGLLTQVYLGDWENPFIELEQLSSFSNGRPAEMEILIEPRAGKAKSDGEGSKPRPRPAA
jgi:hypothetical protein